jgi:UDP-N-acetylglucosamine--N-acetylmuramyl-(pentapeptide) pyrophosphoryl-undecaprenol N-acetylglucosamine transferase
MHIAVACGGTGGHAFPGVATARVLQQRGHDVTLWLAGRDAEHQVVAGWQGPVEYLHAQGFGAGVSLAGIGAACGQVRALLDAQRRLRRRRPAVMLAMGSYASVPPALAARLLGIPFVLHEANAIPGRAVAALARFAAAIGIVFESAAEYLPRGRTRVTGLPLRTLGGARFPEGTLDRDAFTVLAMGGSQGAHRLNEVIPEAMALMARGPAPVQIVHLSGKADEEMVRARYQSAGIRHAVFGFLGEMEMAYGAAHVAVCRSGAGACMELARAGLPAVLVPLPSARRDHQRLNARALADRGAAILLDQGELRAERLAEILQRLQGDGTARATMRAAMQAFAVTDGAERLANLVVAAAAGRHGLTSPGVMT